MMKKIKEWLEEHWFAIAVYSILTVVFIAIVALGMVMTKWIAESDMPEWLKFWLLLGGK
jgi:hypothetical protein